MSSLRTALAIALSLVVHAAVAALCMVLPAAPLSAARAEPAPKPVETTSAFVGDTFEVDALVDRDRQAAPEPPEPEPAKVAAAEPAPAPEPKPRPKPRPREPKPKPKPSLEDKPTESASTGSDDRAGESEERTRAGSFGAEGLPRGVQYLPTAFTRAIAAATNRDPFWAEQPVGAIGTVRVVVGVDDEGQINESGPEDPDDVTPALRRLVDRTLLLLRKGRFALRADALGEGRQTLEIEVTLSQGDPPDGEWDAPNHTTAMGFTPPSPSTPGRAYFVHASGRRFEARVSIER